MSHVYSRRLGVGTVFSAFFASMQWRLMLLWVVFMLLPAAIIAMPVWGVLGSQLDLSIGAARLAHEFDGAAFADIFGALSEHKLALNGTFVLATAVTLLLSPFLTGMATTAIIAPRTPGFGELAHGGLVEYGRQFRLMLLSLLPLGIAFALASFGFSKVADRTELAITEDEVETIGRIAMIIALGLFVFAHATVEAGRAQFAADTRLRSAFRAWWRGFKLVLRRPFAMLAIYVAITAVGLAIAGLLGVWRINVPRATGVGFLLAFGVTQLIVIANAWFRTARLHAFTSAVRAS